MYQPYQTKISRSMANQCSKDTSQAKHNCSHRTTRCRCSLRWLSRRNQASMDSRDPNFHSINPNTLMASSACCQTCSCNRPVTNFPFKIRSHLLESPYLVSRSRTRCPLLTERIASSYSPFFHPSKSNKNLVTIRDMKSQH